MPEGNGRLPSGSWSWSAGRVYRPATTYKQRAVWRPPFMVGPP